MIIVLKKMILLRKRNLMTHLILAWIQKNVQKAKLALGMEYANVQKVRNLKMMVNVAA
jgi:hypothetical protein